jgi:flagellar basal-body rod protein FlgG
VLVTNQGYPVLVKNGQGDVTTLKVAANNRMSIQSDGTISAEGEILGQLKIVNFNKPYPLDPQGNSLFKLHQAQAPVFEAADYKIHQGFLEMSNADPIESMVEMLSVFRNYEANQKSIWAQNESLGKAVNEVGRLS